ncbi:MAG: [FeFe] hydrogenase H-cluster maturation GTPase HydF [Lachnospiraceae bacterium]
MGLNDAPSSIRVQIGLFGRTNAGKSSLINALTGQDLAVVSKVKGTTTDPVSKAMELLPIGPVVMVDTPGLDDEGELGSLRIEKSLQALRKTDVAILVLDGLALRSGSGLCKAETELLKQVKEKQLPCVMAINKSEELTQEERYSLGEYMKAQVKQLFEKVQDFQEISIRFVSAQTGEGIQELKEVIGQMATGQEPDTCLIGDLLTPEDVVILVTPIDAAAPKGRMILPQQQTIRDILDHNAICMVTKETQLTATLDSLKNPPKMVVTDSQAFHQVKDLVPPEIPLTSFSILFARLKGDLVQQVQGARQIDNLKDGDRVLISEGCTHHRQCGDIGTEKLPKLLRKYTGKELHLSFTSGTQFPSDLTGYKLVIHCGGCMLNQKEMKYRLKKAKDETVPMTNYGVAIAHMNGILTRSLEPFKDTLE